MFEDDFENIDDLQEDTTDNTDSLSNINTDQEKRDTDIKQVSSWAAR